MRPSGWRFPAIIPFVIAIVPAAGKGTRMNAVTGGKPKELLTLGKTTVLERVLMESREADVDGVVVVNSRLKHEVDDAIDEWSHSVFADLPIKVAYQEEQRGLGHAVAAAMVEDDALVLVGDVVYHGGSPTHRMVNLIHRGIDGCLAVEHVDEAQMHLYGIVEIDDYSGAIRRVLEKPSPPDTHSRWAVAGRFAFSRAFMALLADYCEDPQRLLRPAEINLTEVINLAIREGMDFKAAALQPDQKRVDCGSAAEYSAARSLSWD